MLSATFCCGKAEGGGGALLPLTGGSRQVQAIPHREKLSTADYQEHSGEERG